MLQFHLQHFGPFALDFKARAQVRYLSCDKYRMTVEYIEYSAPALVQFLPRDKIIQFSAFCGHAVFTAQLMSHVP